VCYAVPGGRASDRHLSEGPFIVRDNWCPAKPGAAMIAVRRHPGGPRAIAGTYEALVGGDLRAATTSLSVPLRRSMHFGRPHRRVPPRRAQELTRRIMDEIAILLGAEREPFRR